MGYRVFCKKHMCMTLANTERTKDKAFRKTGWWKLDCGCKKRNIDDMRVRVRWFLPDGTELVNKQKTNTIWELITNK